MDDTVNALGILLLAYVAGSIPFSNVVARRVRRLDLREVGTGTVSGTSLYRVGGFAPLAVAGVLDVAKGAVGPALAGDERTVVAGLAGGLAVVGHDWSPWLGGAGGRGISPALGALLVHHWAGTVLLLAGLVAGKLLRQTGAGSFVAALALAPVLGWLRGPAGALAGGAVVAPMLVKRVVGNRPPAEPSLHVYASRLVFDHDGDASGGGDASEGGDTSEGGGRSEDR